MTRSLYNDAKTPLVLALVLCCLTLMSAAGATTQPSVAGWVAFEEVSTTTTTDPASSRAVVLPYRQAQLLLRVKAPSSAASGAMTLLGAVPLSATGFFHYTLPSHVEPSSVHLEVVPRLSATPPGMAKEPKKAELEEAGITWVVDQEACQLTTLNTVLTAQQDNTKEGESEAARWWLRVGLQRQQRSPFNSLRPSSETEPSVMQRVMNGILGIALLLAFHFGAGILLKVLEFEIRPPGASTKKNH